MSRVLVVYCSMSGNTKAAAEAVAEVAASAKVEVVVKDWSDAQPEDLVDCSAVAFGSYDAFSYMGGGLKDFFDRAFYPTQNAVTDKPYVAFVTLSFPKTHAPAPSAQSPLPPGRPKSWRRPVARWAQGVHP